MGYIFATFLGILTAGLYVMQQASVIVPRQLLPVFLALAVVSGAAMLSGPSRAH